MLGFYLALFSLIIFLVNKIKKEKIKEYAFYIFIALVFLYVIYLSYLTIARNRIWQDPITFYEYNLEYTPQSYIQHNNLGMALTENGEHEKAIEHYKKTLSIHDGYPQVYSNYANSLLALNRLEEAEKNYLIAIEKSPRFLIPYQRLLFIYNKQGNEEKINELFSRYKEHFDYVNYLDFKLSYYLETQQFDKALEIAIELNKIEPETKVWPQLILQLQTINLNR
jgi:tetratricopeptide (TPR) repeat protein